MIAEKRSSEINEYCNEHGVNDTIKYFNISEETLNRYLRHVKQRQNRHPKVLLFDIETFPLMGYFWTLFKSTVSHDHIIKDLAIISWSAKWLFGKDIIHSIVTREEAVARDDSRIVNELWDLFNDADIIIAHNCKKFDVKIANTRFLLTGLKPPLPYQMVDTLEVFRKYFRLPSNRLDYIGKLICNKGKIETNFDLWKRCDNGDNEALKYMLKYNDEDVLLLEEVYLELRPWIKSHPNMAIYCESNEPACGNCASIDLIWNGDYVTPAGRFNSYRCNACGAIGRSRKSNLTQVEKNRLTVSVAR